MENEVGDTFTLDNYLLSLNEPIDLVYIIGAGHCGSTLLNLCLDMHSEIIGLSEIVTLNKKKSVTGKLSNAMSDDFWGAVARLYFTRTGLSFDQVSFGFNDHSVQNMGKYDANYTNYQALSCVQEVSGKKILADSSKHVGRLEGLLSCPLFNVKIVYLVRDGRAIVNSYYKKYGNLRHGIRKLYRIDREVRRLSSKSEKENWCVVKYEDLTTDTEKVLQKLCAYTGCEFQPEMLMPTIREYKGIGGNRMRNKPISAIKIDTSWKREMTGLRKIITSIAVFGFNLRRGYVGESRA